MKILSVDYGDARTGLAISDSSEFLASPIGTITEYNAEKLAEKIKAEAASRGAQQIVMGLPVNMNGTKGERAQKCEAFGKLLEEKTGLEVVMWDERSTTVSAHRILNEVNVRGKKRKAVVDAVAAVLILARYQADRNRLDN
ncbi:MAG: Holliday junction resolvase RuvX [Ruminococcus sp.]|nr:Holliday junction resolvase RuvX [Ruminococcus sp.]